MPSGLEVPTSPFFQGDDEIITHSFNFSNILPSGGTVSSGTCTVWDLTEGVANVTSTVAPGSVTTAAPSCSVDIKLLEKGHKYRAEMLAILSDAQRYRAELIIQCQR